MTDTPDTSDSNPVAITCSGLWKIFGQREKEALAAIKEKGLSKDQVRDQFGCVVGVKDASFTVRKSEIFCIMGLSGSGKSTLVRHVNRLIEPTAGKIEIMGKDVGRLNPEELRKLRAKTIGMVFQHMALLPHRTVLDNVAIGLELRGVDLATRRAAAHTAVEQVQLDGWQDHYPDQLSGGMQQRVGLARAIAADPDILLMDEPFSALDPLIRNQLQKQFLDLSKVLNKTTLFITHDLDEAIRIGDRIAIMNDGEIVQIGTPQDIAMNPCDDYVAEFVKGLSMLELLDAKAIMSPVDPSQVADIPSGAIGVAPKDKLSHLLKVIEGQDNPLVVEDGENRIGLITKDTLLSALNTD